MRLLAALPALLLRRPPSPSPPLFPSFLSLMNLAEWDSHWAVMGMAVRQFFTYACVSTLLTAAVVSYAFQTRVQFYPTVIFLVTSKVSLLILGNMGLMMTLLLGRITKAVFFGQLRDVEVEILYDNARYAITETCLALTIFREELTTRVLTLFTALLFSKSFHWLCQSRVEYVESDNVSRWTHIRLVTLMVSLLVVDVTFVSVCIYLWRGPSVLILFGFEYTILALSVLSTLIRYILHVIDMSIEGNWPQKGSYIFFLEFVTEVVRFISYVIFFTIIFTYYGMPLHIVRDLWTSYVNLKRRLIIFNKYRKLTANMNERFPDATEEELVACEHTCIICRDAMDSGKKLPCGHIFHLECLRLWLQHQQSCPTCRADIPTDATATAAAAGGTAPVPPAPPGVAAVPPQVPPHAAGGGGARDASIRAPHQAGVPQAGYPYHQPGVGHQQHTQQAPPQQTTANTFPHPPHIPGSMPPPNTFPFPFPPALGLPPWVPPPPFPAPHPPATAGSVPPGPRDGFDPPRWYRVIHPDGVKVHQGPSDSTPVVRTIHKDEVVLCIGTERRTDGQAQTATIYRLLDGFLLEPRGDGRAAGEEGSNTSRLLEPTAAPPMQHLSTPFGYPADVGMMAPLPPHPPSSFSSLFNPFLYPPGMSPAPTSSWHGPTSATTTTTARASGSSSSSTTPRVPLSSTATLEDIRQEVKTSRAEMTTIMRGFSTLAAAFEQEAARMSAALARLEGAAAAAATGGGNSGSGSSNSMATKTDR